METNQEIALKALRGYITERDRAEQQISYAVMDARSAGASWQKIAAELGITKQRAHQIYAAVSTPAPTPKPSKILDADVAGQSVTPSIFLDPIAPAKPETTVITGITPGPPHVKEWPKENQRKRRTEKEVLDSYAAARARKADMPDLCPACGKRWHGQEHWDGRPTAFLDCTETKNDHEWTADWPARGTTTYTNRKASK